MPTRRLVNDNLLNNADFESAPGGGIATTNTSVWIDGTANGSATNEVYGWSTNRGGTASALFDPSTKYEGSYSLKLSTLATGSFMQARRVLGTATHQKLRINSATVAASTSYTLTFYMKTNLVSGSAASGARIAAVQYNAAATALTTGQSTAVTTTTDWTLYTLTFTTQSTCNFLDIQCRVTGNDGSATLIMDAWFDNIILTPTTPVTRTVVS